MTPTRELAELKTGGLDGYVADRRAAGKSWAAISRDLWTDHQLNVSYETLRAWFGGES